MTKEIRRLNLPATGTTKIELNCGDYVLKATDNHGDMLLFILGDVEADHKHPCLVHAMNYKDDVPKDVTVENYLCSFDQDLPSGRSTVHVFVEYTEDDDDEAFEQHQQREDNDSKPRRGRTH